MKKNFGRRRLLDGGLGLGAFLLASRGANAADPHDHAAMMSPTLGMEPDKVVAAMDQPLTEPEVRGSVTVRLRDVRWEDALDVILRSNGLASVQEDTLVRVGTPARLSPDPQR